MSTSPSLAAEQARFLIAGARRRLYAARCKAAGHSAGVPFPTVREVAQLAGYHPDTLYRYSSGVPMSARMASRLRALGATTPAGDKAR